MPPHHQFRSAARPPRSDCVVPFRWVIWFIFLDQILPLEMTSTNGGSLKILEVRAGRRESLVGSCVAHDFKDLPPVLGYQRRSYAVNREEGSLVLRARRSNPLEHLVAHDAEGRDTFFCRLSLAPGAQCSVDPPYSRRGQRRVLLGTRR